MTSKGYTCCLCGHSQASHLGQACRAVHSQYGTRCPCTEFTPCVEPGQIWECFEEVRMRTHDGDMDDRGHIFYPGDRLIASHTHPIHRRPHWIVNFYGVLYQTSADILHNYFRLI